MKRRGVIFGVLSVFAWPLRGQRKINPEAVWFHETVREFLIQWTKFISAYVGCPETAKTEADCNQRYERFDVNAFLDARKAAKKLFGFREDDLVVKRKPMLE